MTTKHLWFSLLAVVAACGDSKTPAGVDAAMGSDVDAAPMADAAAPLGDIKDELMAVPGVNNVVEGTTMATGYRFFTFDYDQPEDQAAPGGTHFAQRMTLMHRDYAAPVIAFNSGYNVSSRGSRAEITKLVNGNQLSLEYRYFAPSRPDPADWTKLDIQQAATDQHRITQALKVRIYHANKWLSTGASKGGMTSLFHRRFYPGDVDGTVAYVAPFDYPADQVQATGNRFITFLDNVGTDAACRQNLKDFQNEVLARRAAMKTRMEAGGAAYTLLGEDKALEFGVEELPFIFWQYGSQDNCANIPAHTATDDDVFAFFDATIQISSYGDDDLNVYLPYYHQCATQLGYPIDDESYLVGLTAPGADTAEAYVPSGQGIVVPAYDEGAAMTDVQSWIEDSGTTILLVYGQDDPWSSGAVDLGGAAGRDSFKFIEPGGNHGSSISGLASADMATATDAVMRWAGMPAAKRAPTTSDGEVTTEHAEFLAHRHHGRR